MENKHLTSDEAFVFFSDFYGGEHHFPSEIKSNGFGFSINDGRSGFATFDSSKLTRLVLMAHERAIRVELTPIRNGIMKIAIWKRQRAGNIMERHPTIETAIENFRNSY